MNFNIQFVSVFFVCIVKENKANLQKVLQIENLSLEMF